MAARFALQCLGGVMLSLRLGLRSVFGALGVSSLSSNFKTAVGLAVLS
jgi:hypothetical protein